jgi:fructan beta-fructosidase
MRARALLCPILILAVAFLARRSLAEQPSAKDASVAASLKPLLHFTTPEGWLNDPNGLYQWNGVWNMQYQTRWPRAWGHASSVDLLHWTHLPIALTPDENGDCWSGSTVLDARNTSGLFHGKKGGLVSIYASQKADTGQTISLAISSDGGLTWTRPPGNPVLRGATKQFRDPKVLWHKGSKQWAMVLTEATHLTFFVSPDLRHWRETSRLALPPQPGVDALECPDLFKLPVAGHPGQSKWVLSVSYSSASDFKGGFGYSAVRYLVGEFDGKAFKAEDGLESTLPMGDGPDQYATITWQREAAGAHRTMAIGWMDHWGYAKSVPTQTMTLPRELTLHETTPGHWQLRQQAPRELWSYPGTVTHPTLRVQDAEAGTAPLATTRCGAVRATLKPDADADVEFTLFGSSDSKTVVGYDAARRVLYFDRRLSGGPEIHPHFRLRKEVPLRPAANGLLQLDIVFDFQTAEIFAGGGEVYLSALVFPEASASAVSVKVIHGRTAVKSIEVFNFEP